MLQHFGSGGSPSADVTVNVPVNWALTTTPQRFSVLLPIPAIAGKTHGTTANTHYLQVYVQYPPTGTYAINTAQWQLEQSSPNAPSAGMPTTFEYRGVQAELARVQRYYETASVFSGVTWEGNTTSTTAYQAVSKYVVPKRATPAVTLVGTAVSGFGVPTVTTGDATGVQLGATASSTYGYFQAGYIADARL